MNKPFTPSHSETLRCAQTARLFRHTYSKGIETSAYHTDKAPIVAQIFESLNL